MGTRSLTAFVEDGVEICTLYRQMDGSPSGQGRDLAKIIGGLSLTNGLAGNPKKYANGIGELAAFVIADLKAPGGKRMEGNFYLVKAEGKLSKAGDLDSEYVYTVAGATNNPTIRVRVTAKPWSGDSRSAFDGTAKEFAAWIKAGAP